MQWGNRIFFLLTMIVLGSPASAQEDFFDKMLSISDQELEKASELPETKPATPPVTPEKPVETIAPLVGPPNPLPVTPNVITPLPDTTTQPKAEILMELPPAPDEVLEQTGEIPLPSPQEEMVGPTQPIPPIQPQTDETLSEKAAALPETLPAEEAVAPQPPSAVASPSATAPKAAVPAANWTGSMMFTAEEYQRLRQAISIYERKTGQKTTVPGAAPNATVAAPSRTPAFYLGSIVYVSPEQWAVWINGKKYTKDTVPDGVRITGVLSDRVRLLWKVDSLDIIIPDWRSKLTATGDGNYVSANNLVQVNAVGTDISFTLRPNQSFVSSGMRIAEGVVSDSAVLN